MQIYSPTLKGPLKISGYIDPDDVTKISVFWGAPLFSTSTVYRSGDITRPSQDNGYYYQCSVNGISGSSEPSWDQEETISGQVTFTAIPWNLWILPEESISTSSWSASNNMISLSDSYFNDYYSEVIVSDIPNTITDFELTNQITKDNGEKLSRTFLYKIHQQ